MYLHFTEIVVTYLTNSYVEHHPPDTPVILSNVVDALHTINHH